MFMMGASILDTVGLRLFGALWAQMMVWALTFFLAFSSVLLAFVVFPTVTVGWWLAKGARRCSGPPRASRWAQAASLTSGPRSDRMS